MSADRMLRGACLLALLAGCAPLGPGTPAGAPPEESVAAPAATRRADAWLETPLSRLAPEPAVEELLLYQRHWCARAPGERRNRRAALPAADRLERLLLDYCEGARDTPGRLRGEIERLEAEREWPDHYREYFAWLRWHLEAFAAASAAASAERQRLEHTIQRLRAIEDDIHSRERVEELDP